MSVPEPTPALVTVHLWGVPSRQVPAALLRMAVGPRPVRRQPGARFAKLLGTAGSASFGLRDTDLRHWALVTTWTDAESADAFARSRTAGSWDRISEESVRVRMRPLASRGTWSRRAPFGDPDPRPSAGSTGPVAALTRARIRPSMLRRFARSVPPVARDLTARGGSDAGALLALGIGETPIGLQGTFSLWPDTAALQSFAHRGPAHVQAIKDTARLDWYSEELFARFAVESAHGCYRGRPIELGSVAS